MVYLANNAQPGGFVRPARAGHRSEASTKEKSINGNKNLLLKCREASLPLHYWEKQRRPGLNPQLGCLGHLSLFSSCHPLSTLYCTTINFLINSVLSNWIIVARIAPTRIRCLEGRAAGPSGRLLSRRALTAATIAYWLQYLFTYPEWFPIFPRSFNTRSYSFLNRIQRSNALILKLED